MFALYPALAFLDGQLLPAHVLNQWRTNIARSIDGTGGSAGVAYAPLTSIDIAGAGITMSGPFVLGTGASSTVQSGVTVTYNNGSTIARSGAENLSGVGATTAWRTALTTDATPQTYDVTYDEFRVPANITAGGGLLEYTLRHSTTPTATEGNRLRFSRNGTAFAGSARFRREDTTLLATMTSSGSGFSFVEFCYCRAPGDATARWRAVAWGGDITIAAVV